MNLAQHPLEPRHGGQVSTTGWHYFEVVYWPQEIRVFVYSPSQRPLNTTSIKGQVFLRVLSSGQVHRFAVTPVAGRLNEDAYLTTQVDLTHVRDGDMEVMFNFTDLPVNEEKRAVFAQPFYLSRPPVTVAPLTAADRPLVERQRVCPIMNAALGDHGQPIKLLVGREPLFVCCEQCIGEVRKNPQASLQKVSATLPVNMPQQPAAGFPAAPQMPAAGLAPQYVVAVAMEADRPAAMRQGQCPVTGQVLGPAAPVKITKNGRELFVCCGNCVREVERNVDGYLTQFGAPVQYSPSAAGPPNPAQEQNGVLLPSQRAQPVLPDYRAYDPDREDRVPSGESSGGCKKCSPGRR